MAQNTYRPVSVRSEVADALRETQINISYRERKKYSLSEVIRMALETFNRTEQLTPVKPE